MQSVLILTMQAQLRLFVDGIQQTIGGELDNVPDTDASWRRMRDNINISPVELELTIIYGKMTAELLNRCVKYFSDAAILRLTNFDQVFDCLSAVYDRDVVNIGGYDFKRDEGGRLRFVQTPFANGDISLARSIEGLRQKLKETQREKMQSDNRVKSLQKRVKTLQNQLESSQKRLNRPKGDNQGRNRQ